MAFFSRKNFIWTRQGVLLIEALLAIVILTVTLTVLIESLVSSLRTTFVSADHTRAMWLTENKMFELYAKKSIENTYQDAGKLPGDDQDYHYVISAQPAQGEAEDLLSEVTLTVLWSSRGNARQLPVVAILPGARKKE